MNGNNKSKNQLNAIVERGNVEAVAATCETLTDAPSGDNGNMDYYSSDLDISCIQL